MNAGLFSLTRICHLDDVFVSWIMGVPNHLGFFLKQVCALYDVHTDLIRNCVDRTHCRTEGQLHLTLLV